MGLLEEVVCSPEMAQSRSQLGDKAVSGAMPGDRQEEPGDMEQLKDSIHCPSTRSSEVTYPL